jgi:phenylalanyl-tRNA synthetase beta chain
LNIQLFQNNQILVSNINMKFTLSTLHQFLETSATPEIIGEKLTALGLEVEAVKHLSAGLESFTVAHILSAKPHPEADKLQICEVETCNGVRQIVCGAPNARADLKVVLADIGAVIPASGLVIKPAKIRGIESQGMLCSGQELGLNDESDGIIELPNDAEIGAMAVDILGLNEAIFDISITPNRGDCLNVAEIARELAAAGIGQLINKSQAKITPVKNTNLVQINHPDCKHFIAYKLNNVANGASPEWLQKALKMLGQKPISALVDITNYFSLIYGRPLHVYDADKLRGCLNVRAAIQGEKFNALNGATYELPVGSCVIADEAGVQGLAGIIGGTDSACDLTTINVLLEAAWFEPISIANAGRALQIDSDARYRFERYVDPTGTKPLAAFAAEMILEICGGELSEYCEVGAAVSASKTFTFEANYINSRLGINIDKQTQIQLLKAIGCEFVNDNIITPAWRNDVDGLHDIAEEVARLHGYEHLHGEPLPAHKLHHPAKSKEDLARNIMLQRGIDEVVHFAFTKPEYAQPFKTNAELVEVLNPISRDLSIMRPHLYADLLQALANNIAHGNHNLAIGQIGNLFLGLEPQMQTLQMAALRLSSGALHWNGAKNYDLFSAKADLMAVLQGLKVNIDAVTLSREVPNWYHPSASGRISLGAKNTLGYFGELHPACLRAFGIETKVFAFECWLDNVPPIKTKRKSAYQPCEFQSSRKDFAFVVDNQVAAGELQNAIKKAGGALIQSVNLFDIYQGDKMESGKKSLAYAVILQANDRTLQETDILTTSNAIITAAEKLGAKLR